jgi:hypothetical protein
MDSWDPIELGFTIRFLTYQKSRHLAATTIYANGDRFLTGGRIGRDWLEASV